MKTVNYNNEYRNYSEIDYLLGSNLDATPEGVGKAIQRLSLFDLSRRHIPYLLLIYKVFYNTEFPKADKKETINKLLDGLYREVIRKNDRNQLLDFFPEYFVYSLLLDLYIAGYKINHIVKSFKYEIGPVMDLIKYGNFSITGFPQTFWKFIDKYMYLGKSRERYLFDIAKASLKAQNLNGFYDILGRMKDKELRTTCLSEATIAHIERNERDQAMKIAGSESDKISKSAKYLDIAVSLSRVGNIDALRELKHSTNAPELLIGIIFGMMDYHAHRGEVQIVDSLLDEAFVFLDKTEDYTIKVLRLISLMEFTYTNGYFAKSEKCKQDILFYMPFLKNEDKKMVQYFFCRRLSAIGQVEQVLEYAHKWYFPDDGEDEFWMHHNMNTFFQVMVEQELNSIDYNIQQDKHLSPLEPVISSADYFKSPLDIACLIEDDLYKEFSMQVIAERMSKYGFYEEAIKIMDSIKNPGYQSEIAFSIPMFAVANGNVTEALHYAGLIHDQKTRMAVQLCMAPHLEKLNHTGEAATFIREWANYTFQNS